jgi:hypothetical protein
MKNIKRFNNFKLDEGIFDDISRLNPERKANDIKFSELTQDIIEDFEANNKDLRKVKILDDGGTDISLDKIKIGKSYSFVYVFGKYHPVLRDIHTGNVENGDRRIKLSKVPFSFTIRKNELEKMFNTGRVNTGVCRVSDVKTTPNYDRNPNIGNYRLHNTKKDEYKISSDMANYIFTYFMEQYDTQYPELKGIKSKSSWDIRDIKKGVPVPTKFITVKGKDGDDLTLQLRKGDNEKEIRQKLSNMTKAEYEIYCKQKRDEIYADSNKKSKAEKEAMSEKISTVIKSLGINLKSESKWEPNGFSLQYYSYAMSIDFKTNDMDVVEKIKGIKDKGIDGFKFKNIRVSDGLGNSDMKFIHIEYEALEY